MRTSYRTISILIGLIGFLIITPSSRTQTDVLPNHISAQAICSRFDPNASRCDLTAAAITQAKCLLQPVKKFGNLGGPLTALPSPLDSIVGQPTGNSITVNQIRTFLTAKSIREADVGGSLSPIDLGYPDRHDDPQNFDLELWSSKLDGLIQQIRAIR